jgi:RND family efflux transporter MFP subunit
MKISTKWIICILLAIASFGWSQEPPSGFPPQTVRVDAAQTESLQNRHFVTGELRAFRRSSVAAQEAGQVNELFLREGQTVQTGDILVKLDSERLQIQKLQAQADMQVIVATIEQVKAELELSQWQYAAFQELAQRGSSHENEIRKAKSTVAVSQAKMVQAEKQIEVVQARIALLDRRLADSIITAPFDAALVKLHTELGQWLDVGDPVADIVSIGKIDAWLDIPESLTIARPVDHLNIEIAITALNQRFVLASPRMIQDINPQTRTFSLIATLDDQKAQLKPGLSVTGWIPTGKKQDYVTISNDAINRSQAGAFVFIAQRNPDAPAAVAVPQPVKLLFHAGDRVAIETSSVKAGDLLIVEGNERLMPGMPVMFIED